MTALDEELAQIVYAMGMVGVLVRVKHAVKPVDIGIEELLAQIRRGVDQNTSGAVARAAFD